MVWDDTGSKPSSSRAVSVISTSIPSPRRSVSWTTPNSCKGTLEGCFPFTVQVLNHGHTTFCLHIAMVNRFPSVSKKMQESWASLQEGVKGSTDLEEELTRIGQDTSLKERVVNYVGIFPLSDLLLMRRVSDQGPSENLHQLQHSWNNEASRCCHSC